MEHRVKEELDTKRKPSLINDLWVLKPDWQIRNLQFWKSERQKTLLVVFRISHGDRRGSHVTTDHRRHLKVAELVKSEVLFHAGDFFLPDVAYDKLSLFVSERVTSPEQIPPPPKKKWRNTKFKALFHSVKSAHSFFKVHKGTSDKWSSL